MKIWLICSKAFYSYLDSIKKELEQAGHKVYLPNCYDDPTTEGKMRESGSKVHANFKAKMFRQSRRTAEKVDAGLVVNMDKQTKTGVIKNYIGGATLLEMYDLFLAGKPTFLFNPIPDNMLHDEINGFAPIIINGDLRQIKKSKKSKKK